ncbi:MAG: PAS domain-containing protein [Deltaproteobacteria bacterium]|nr:PAS domain-containing protein [Deltaproteobacteria bacterium]
MGTATPPTAEQIDAGPWVIYRCRPDDGFALTYVSRGVRSLLGCAPDELTGSRTAWIDRVHPEDRERALAWRRRVAREPSGPAEYRLRGGDGVYRVVRDAARSAEAATGAGLELVGLWVDITERHQAEELARIEARRFRQILDDAPDVIYRYRIAPTPGFEYVNRAATEQSGYPLEQFYGDPMMPLKLAHPDDLPRVAELMRSSSHRDKPLVARWITADGQPYWTETRSRPIFDDQGHLIGELGVSRNVTEQKRAESALRAIEQRYELLARVTNDAIWDWDLLADLMTWNDGLRTVFGYGPGDVGRTPQWWSERVHPDDRERIVASRQAVVQGGGQSWSAEYRFRVKDGRYATVIDRAYLLRDERDEPQRMIGSMLDVSDRRQVHDRQLQANRLTAMGSLARAVTHQISDPLSCVIGNLGYLAKTIDRLGAEGLGPAGAELKQGLREALEGARRVRQIVRDLKSFAWGDDREQMLLDVVPILEMAVNMVSNEVRHRAQIVLNYGPVPRVAGSEAQLGQAFLNLLLNAAQSIPEGQATRTALRVSTRTDSRGNVVIEVQSSGPPLAPEQRARLFDVPDGGDTATMGLGVCRAIVEALGGAVVAESRPDQGPAYRIELPSAADERPTMASERRPEDPRRASDPSVDQPRRARILVVDDEEAVGLTVQRVLGDDHEVWCTTRATDALEKLETEEYDLILCDVMMPEMSGAELYAAVLARRPALAARMAFMTGGAFAPSAHEFLRSVRARCLEKPFEVGRIRAFVASILRQAS